MSDSLTRRRLRAPQEHGTALIDPPLARADRLLAANQSLIRQYDYDCHGRQLTELVEDARQEVMQKAREYTTAYRDIDDRLASDSPRPVLLTGHQPQLFHAGVWFKNLAIAKLGESLNACPINLLIDNDTVRGTSLRVPTGSLTSPRIESVALDGPAEEMPFEDRNVLDRELLTTLDRRVKKIIAPFVDDPLIERMWRPINEILARTENLGRCIAQARHIYEGELRLNTLELPFSQVCQSQPFYWFVAHLLAQLPRFWEIYNSSLYEFRLANRLRSRTHPVPDLAMDDEWLETPFWVWTTDDPHRRRLFAKRCDDQVELTDRGQLVLSLSLSDDGDAQRAVEQLETFAKRDIKVRPRALLTTMYSRLVLGDLFLHGIGGAKYDELTDVIIRRFFQLDPPAFMTLSATMSLPIELSQVSLEDLRQATRQLRELVYHPEKHLNDECRADGKITSLLAEKNRWIETIPPRGQGRRRHEEISRINGILGHCVEKKRDMLTGKRRSLSAQLRYQAVLSSREFSFCLFPERTLLPRLLELSGG